MTTCAYCRHWNVPPGDYDADKALCVALPPSILGETHIIGEWPQTEHTSRCGAFRWSLDPRRLFAGPLWHAEDMWCSVEHRIRRMLKRRVNR